ncbi:MAG: hypothetical protein WDW36_010071 [Sanguina aurantia]
MAYYPTESWSPAANLWLDASGNGNNAVLSSGSASIITSGSFSYLSGLANSSITFPVGVLPNPYTLFYIARYNPAAVTANRGRIFDGLSGNWLSGFKAAATGNAYHWTQWITAKAANPVVLKDLYPTSWFLGTDSMNLLRTNGVTRSLGALPGETANGAMQLTINGGTASPAQNSDWNVAAVVVYRRTLNYGEIVQVENFLAKKYGLVMTQPPVPPSPPSSSPPPFPPPTRPPVSAGLIGYYSPESWQSSTNVWLDQSGAGNHANVTMGNIAVTNPAGAGFATLSGDYNAGIRFPANILPTPYTLFFVARYSPNYNYLHSDRIFDCYGSSVSFWSGFQGGSVKTARHGTNLTTTTFPISSVNSGWISCTDAPSVFRCNGQNLLPAGVLDSPMYVAPPLAINYGDSIAYGGASDWDVATVIVFNRTLTYNEFQDMERWLNTKYAILNMLEPPAPPPSPPTPPPLPMGGPPPSPPMTPPPAPVTVTTPGSYYIIGQSVNVAVHIIQMPGGNEFLLLSRTPGFIPGDSNQYKMTILNISTMTSQAVNVSDDIWCSGHTLLPNGDIMIVGGWPLATLRGTQTVAPGANRRVVAPVLVVRIFSLAARSIVWDAPIPSARYYPTVTVLPNNVVAVLGGNDGTDYVGLVGIGAYKDYWLINTPANPLTASNLTSNVTQMFLPNVSSSNGFFPTGYTWTGYYPVSIILPDESLWLMMDTVGGIINPMTSVMYMQLPLLNSSIHFEHRSTAGSAPLMLSSDNNYTVVELLMNGGKVSLPGQSTLTAGSSLSYRMKVTLQGNNIYSANPWVVEDSGYKRVMGDMTVLPNGQVVIANGIQLGVAGYGSGFVPVLDAQLYDPDLPLGSRFSYIASSVIPRQYHSTQALVSDGRVMIAGCDDLPGCFYGNTVELLTPPCLQNLINPRPIISAVSSAGVTAQNLPGSGPLSLVYGASLAVSISNYSPSNTTLWASLVTPSSVSHTRNMHQRVIKIASLTQSTDSVYTFKIPAAQGVAVPGWYMLFVMNGKVYSTSAWVKISQPLSPILSNTMRT